MNVYHLSINDKLSLIIDAIAELRRKQDEILGLPYNSLLATEVPDELDFGSVTLPLDSEQSMTELSDLLKDKPKKRLLVNMNFRLFLVNFTC